MPSLPKIASKERLYLRSRSWIKKRARWLRSSRSISRLRACCVIHCESGWRVQATYPTRRSVRVRTAARDDPSVPAQQRLGGDEERVPQAPRDYSAQRRQDEPVALRQLRPPRLPPQDRQLVAQNEQLEFLRAITAREQ